MKVAFRQTQLYTFLLYCNGVDLDKKILDCGAGGVLPPLAIFAEHGYETCGIDISKAQIDLAKNFEEKHNLELGIMEGDMKKIPFEDESISFVYSYNSIFHMSKEEIGIAIKEIYRILPKGGLAFINFPSTKDFRSAVGEKIREGEYLQEEHGEKILHSYFEDDEADKYFKDFKIIYKEKRVRDGYASADRKITLGFIDYIVEKL